MSDTEEDYDSETEIETDSESKTEVNNKDIQREQTGESQPDDEERQRRQEELNKKLVKAAGAGNNEDVIQQIRDGADITSKDSNGDTGLHLSADRGHKDVLQTFITHKADLNIRGHSQSTALINAAVYGQLSCAQLLLAHGADTDLKTGRGRTALIYAAEKNYPDIISTLLAHGANDKIQDNDGRDALKWAKNKNRQQDAIRMFTAWKKRSNVSQEMMTAAEEGRWRLLTGLVIAGADVETRNARGETGLDLAIRSGNMDPVLTFLDKGVNGYNREECLQKFDRNKKLVEAADSGDNESVTRLLQEGAEITSRDSDGDTGLHLSARNGHMDVLQTFITHKADLNIRDFNQRTPLINAAAKGQLSCAQLLVAHGADTDLQSGRGMTALMWGAKKNYPEIISALLAHGTDDQIKDNDGRDALKLAEEEGNQDAVKVLKACKEHPYKVTEHIIEEVKKENANWGLVKSLIAVHPHINHLNQNGETPLRLAWNAENIKLVKLLLDRGAQFDLQNFKGETSLQIEQYIEKNDVQKRENVIDLMIEYDKKRNPESLIDSQFRMKKEIKNIVPSSGNLRDCLMSISDKYPWSGGKYKVMLAISFILRVFRGSFLYTLDVFTDIQFALDMFRQANRNFVEDLSKCQQTFEKNFDVAIETCKINFDKITCMEAIDQVHIDILF